MLSTPHLCTVFLLFIQQSTTTSSFILRLLVAARVALLDRSTAIKLFISPRSHFLHVSAVSLGIHSQIAGGSSDRAHPNANTSEICEVIHAPRKISLVLRRTVSIYHFAYPTQCCSSSSASSPNLHLNSEHTHFPPPSVMDVAAPSAPSASAVPSEDIEMTKSQAEDMQKPVNESAEEGGSAGGGEGVTVPDASHECTTFSSLRAHSSSDALFLDAARKMNGEQGHPNTNPPTQSSEPTHTSEDTHMGDTAAPMASIEDSVAETAPSASNGTPPTNKRASISASSKKKSAAVPEHKSKKLNKKKSKPLTNLEAQPGQYYFARMKGHPPWPSIICDEEMLPLSLLTTRPVTAALPDGSFKKADYADGGKRAYERTFPVMFL